jgi:hypothetical protein
MGIDWSASRHSFWGWKIMPPDSPLEPMLKEIEHALEAKLYYLAIMTSLAVPDVCAALEHESGRTKASRYMRWYKDNLGQQYPFITPQDIYSLRCGILHQGRAGSHGQYDRILFTLPGDVRFHNNILNRALNLDAELFCRDVIQAARQWLERTTNDRHVRANLTHLVRLRPNGLAPYMIGAPVIT